jgi:Ca2+/Na+ antiporter
MAANGNLPQMPKNTPRFLERFSKGEKVGFFVLGFVLGIIGILISWAIGHRKKMLECSAEAIWYSILGCAVGGICSWCSYVMGVPNALYSLFGEGITVWAGLLLACYICFIILSMLWIYGLRPKMSDAERVYQMRGDDWIKPDEKFLRYDAGITINALPNQIWPYMQQAGQSKAGWYSFERLERLFTFDIRNHYDWTKYPQWQNLHVGEFQWFHQAPLSIGEWVTECSNGEDGNYFWASHSDSRTDPSYKVPGPDGEAALKLWFKFFCWTWNWEVYQINEVQSRFIYRCDCTFAPFARTPIHKYFVVFILGTASIVMGRCCMETITRLSEGQRNFRKKYFD